MAAISNLILLILLFWLPVLGAQEVNFAIDHVAINTTKCQNIKAIYLQFACHRLERGRGYVVAERRYYPPKKTDDDAFEKLTVYFHSRPRPDYIINLPSEEADIFFSAGPSSFPGRYGCYGAAKAGKIEVARISEKEVTVKVDVIMDLRSPFGWKGECKQARLQKKISAHVIDFERLNAWYGLVEPNYDLWEESHPQAQ